MKYSDNLVRAQHAVPEQNRRSIRLQGYDYSRTGAYFVTICIQNRVCLFGEIVDSRMRLNDAGHVVRQCWNEIPDHFPHVDTDAFVVMPNHIHGIIVVNHGTGTACRAPTATVGTIHGTGTACRAPTVTVEKFGQPVVGSIPTVIRSFKSAATRRINDFYNSPGSKLWQRNYWEHIIRDNGELNLIREYIHNNLAQWELDKLFVG